MKIEPVTHPKGEIESDGADASRRRARLAQTPLTIAFEKTFFETKFQNPAAFYLIF